MENKSKQDPSSRHCLVLHAFPCKLYATKGTDISYYRVSFLIHEDHNSEHMKRGVHHFLITSYM